ncbi:hypothetical protein [Roseovarius sp. MBR-6]|jgi:hypothetical protein|uniref:hypothetical protein n=1 Tax=Roseovarius sp. MBR-6 TaxID=3156459 RepID=UPI003399920A
MKKDQKPSKSSRPSAKTEDVAKSSEKAQEGDASTNDRGQGTDRPGFDLGGSTGETHAGTGLGLGEDAFDTPGDRRLPGRQLDNKLTIPRWGGPEPRDSTASDEKTAGAENLPAPETKKTR